MPAPLDAIVRRCLEKNPQQRFQSAADLAFALRSIGGASTSEAGALKALPAARRNFRLPAIAAVAALALFGAGYFLRSRLAPSGMPQFHRITFREGRVTMARFTADGENVVYSANWEGAPSRIFMAMPGNPEARDPACP